MEKKSLEIRYCLLLDHIVDELTKPKNSSVNVRVKNTDKSHPKKSIFWIKDVCNFTLQSELLRFQLLEDYKRKFS